MKLKKLLGRMACIVALAATCTACGDDNDAVNWNEGAAVELPRERIFILNQGNWNSNDATLTFYDPQATGTVDKVVGDIYLAQNGKKLGDTGQAMIAYRDDLYIVVSGSKYIARLNGAGVEQCRYAFSAEQGDPRYLAAEDGKIYVSLWSGVVMRLDAETLQPEATVAVGSNPETLVIEDDKLYCVNCSYYTAVGNTVSVIDLATFKVAQTLTIFENPQRIVECNDRLFVQGYGSTDYQNYTYPVAMLNPTASSGTACQEIGQATHMATYGNTLYLAYSYTDWTTYVTTNTFWSYNTATGKRSDVSFLKNAPEELSSASIYMLEVNPENGDIYVGIAYYSTSGKGDVYRFSSDGTFIESFETGGQGPVDMAFLD